MWKSSATRYADMYNLRVELGQTEDLDTIHFQVRIKWKGSHIICSVPVRVYTFSIESGLWDDALKTREIIEVFKYSLELITRLAVVVLPWDEYCLSTEIALSGTSNVIVPSGLSD